MSFSTWTIDGLTKEIERLKHENECLHDTIKAWFDDRRVTQDMLTPEIMNMVRNYLRTSRSGGMPVEMSDCVDSIISDMCRLGYFAEVFALIHGRKNENG